MSDDVVAKDQGSGFTPHDEGQFAAACADVVGLGERVERYPGKPERVVEKCALVFVTNTVGETKEVSAEFTVSMNERASLRLFLELWRGKGYSPEQAAAGVPLRLLRGKPALITVEHKRSQKGRIYAKIRGITALPPGLTAPDIDGYQRAAFWGERKKLYATEAEQFKQTIAKSEQPQEPSPEDDDDLPF